MGSEKTRREDLKALRDGLQTRMEDCSSDQNYAVMGRLLVDVLKQIEEIDQTGGQTKPGEESVLSEFETKLRVRRSGS